MTNTKKELGQHWLHDTAVLTAMADSIDLQAGDTVLEVGPGLGTLTEILAERAAQVITVELDSQLIPSLRRKFSSNPSVSIVEEDILKFNLDSLPVGYKVAANIPYYLTSHLLRKLTEAENTFSFAALLVQKEVAERVCAEPGDMSVLSVAVGLYADTKLGPIVPAGLFMPPPQVDSQILLLHHLGKPRFDVDAKRFFHVVKAGFSERRKKLRSSLSGGLSVSKQDAEQLLGSAGIDPNLRAQALSLDDWFRLYSAWLDDTSGRTAK